MNNTDNALVYLSAKLAKSSKPKPKLFQCCGTEDFLYGDNLNFRDHIEKTGAFKLHYSDRVGEWVSG